MFFRRCGDLAIRVELIFHTVAAVVDEAARRFNIRQKWKRKKETREKKEKEETQKEPPKERNNLQKRLHLCSCFQLHASLALVANSL